MFDTSVTINKKKAILFNLCIEQLGNECGSDIALDAAKDITFGILTGQLEFELRLQSWNKWLDNRGTVADLTDVRGGVNCPEMFHVVRD